MNKEQYKEYLNSEKWKTKRSVILKKRGRYCSICSGELFFDFLHIHHLTYENLGNEKDADLIVVCATCHKAIHYALKNKHCDLSEVIPLLKARIKEIKKSIIRDFGSMQYYKKKCRSSRYTIQGRRF